MRKVLLSIRNLKYSYPSDKTYCLKIDSLDILQGDIIALIGTNGAGKTTLLSILAGILEQTKGTVNFNGEIFSLISLGLLLDESKTGIENIKRTFEIFDIPYKKDDLRKTLEYTELSSEKLDESIKTYSTGMKSRIAFAPLSLINKDIYLIDEIMAVGDIKFASKSYKTIVEKIKSGNSCSVICSHSTQTVVEVANKVIWLEEGKIKEMGKPDIICKKYQDYINNKTASTINSVLDSFQNKNNLIEIKQIKYDILSVSISRKSINYENCKLEISRLNGFEIAEYQINFDKKKNKFKLNFRIDKITDQYLLFILKDDSEEILCEYVYELKRGKKAFSGDPLFCVDLN